MKILVFSICHNEAAILPYYLRHYAFADKIIIADNHSSDDSAAICQAAGVEVVSLDTQNLHDTISLRKAKNQFWKAYRDYDWIFVVDMDEFIYHPDIIGFLTKMQADGVTVPVPTGYQMVADHFPANPGPIEIKTGLIADDPVCHALFTKASFNKKCIINPKEVIETNYSVGSHGACMTGNVKEYADPELKLLHYRCLGLEYLLGRNRMRSARQSGMNKKKGFGRHYSFEEEKTAAAFKELLLKAKDVI